MKTPTNPQNLVLDAILGLALGDALGAPNEFHTREEVAKRPLTSMPHEALYTDDTSMNLCLLDALMDRKTIDYKAIMDNFILWVGSGAFTPQGKAFGMGNTTMNALERYMADKNPFTSGSTDEFENGNGALMRILPLSFYLYAHYQGDFLSSPEGFKVACQTIALTHAHPRNITAVTIYLAIAEDLILARLSKGGPLTFLQFRKAILKGSKRSIAFLEKNPLYRSQVPYFSKFLENPKTKKIHLETFREQEIRSSGYVVDTLEAAVWSCLTLPDYKTCVLKAANLGDDADTVAAVAGGLAGLAYGEKAFPSEWLKNMVDLATIKELSLAYQSQLTFLK